MKTTTLALAFATLLFGPGGSRAADPSAAPQLTIGPDIPHDVAGGTRLPPSQASETQLANFAWQQFLALCWQSNYNPTTPSRGTPDKSWSYKMPYKAGQPLVWETYAHRTELRPGGVLGSDGNFKGVPLDKPFSKPPLYLIGNKTIKPADGANFNLFNNLDEDSEIGSCNIYYGPANPAKGDPTKQHLVLYQAKVNQAEYDYIAQNFGKDQFDPNGKLAMAQRLNKESIKKYKKPDPGGVSLPAGDNGNPAPQGEGAIEIKTAFLLVTPENSSAFQDFFQTQAIYYTADVDTTKNPPVYSNWQYHNGTFALLAIHVIHKTKSYPDFIFTSFEHQSLAAKSFQYILTTPAPPTYSNFNPFNAQPPPPPPPPPPPLNPVTGVQFGDRHLIKRQSGTSPTSNGQLYPIPPYLDMVTQAVHAQLAALNPKSVWLNYRLMGVQANITDAWAPNPSADAGPNHFMANHVVESDAFLANFFGQGFGTNPFPGVAMNSNSKRVGLRQDLLVGSNLLYNGQVHNMGGCKGCHGVAQTSFGTDFSFLLDVGHGKPVVSPDTIFYHPGEQ